MTLVVRFIRVVTIAYGGYHALIAILAVFGTHGYAPISVAAFTLLWALSNLSLLLPYKRIRSSRIKWSVFGVLCVQATLLTSIVIGNSIWYYSIGSWIDIIGLAAGIPIVIVNLWAFFHITRGSERTISRVLKTSDE